MTTSLSHTELKNPRYAVSHRITEVNGSEPMQADFQIYCETWAEVKEVLQRHIVENARFYYAHQPEQWHALACKVSCWNYRRPYLIGTQYFSDKSYKGQWQVVALKEYK